MLKVGVFDLDGTILKNTTAERQLFSFLLKRGIISLPQILSFGNVSLRMLLEGKVNRLRTNKHYLKGVKTAVIRALLPDFCSQALGSFFSKRVVEKMRSLKGENYHILVLSGAPDLILEYLQKNLPFDSFIGSRLETKNGYLTGEIFDVYPYGNDKVVAFKNHFNDTTIDYEASFAFANKYSDVSLLETFGHPVAVYPDRKLLDHARTHGWEVIE